MAIINERIKERRIANSMTLLELAEILGVKEATMQRYESGAIKNIKHETVVALAKALGCTPGYLMGWDQTTQKTGVSDDEIKLALWNGEKGMTDEQYEEIKNFANFIKMRNK